MKPQILVVDDEPSLRETLQFALENEGLETIGVGVGLAALPILEKQPIDVIVLDVGLPDINGFELLKQIRKTWPLIPIIMLTARAEEVDRVLGLEFGADDYVVKPFSPREFAARVKTSVRRSQLMQTRTKGFVDTFALDTEKRTIHYFGVPLELSKFEYEILKLFVERRGKVLSREQVMNLAWDSPESSMDRAVDTHIRNLRSKLRAVRPELDPIQTHRGVGYSLREDL